MNTNNNQLQELILKLEQRKVLKNKTLKQALLEIDRKDFVLDSYKELAYVDEALPIGFGQTISQPYTVIFMLELLEVKIGYNILEVGYGSGWQTALLAYLVGERGHIFAVEVLTELCKFGRNNLSKYPHLIKRISFYCRNAKYGLPKVARKINGFDRIICAASVNRVPINWKQQLKVGGILVYPSQNSIYKEIKKSENKFTIEEHYGFSFVPFIE